MLRSLFEITKHIRHLWPSQLLGLWSWAEFFRQLVHFLLLMSQKLILRIIGQKLYVVLVLEPRSQELSVRFDSVVCEPACCPRVRHGIWAGCARVYQHEKWDLPPIGLLSRNLVIVLKWDSLMGYKYENGILYFSPGSRKSWTSLLCQTMFSLPVLILLPSNASPSMFFTKNELFKTIVTYLFL